MVRKRFPFTFEQCESRLTDYETGRQYLTSRLCNNTYLLRKLDHYAIALHGTEIIRIYEDGRYILSEGEWHTPTTFSRLSSFCPLPIRQVGKKWLVMLKDFTEIEFRNEMVVSKNGELLSYP